MKKKKKSFSVKPVILLSAAALLLLGSTVGSARAALTYYSENYSVQMSTSNIGVSLIENGDKISYRDYNENDEWNESTGTLLSDLKKEKLVLGKTYDEKLSVTNSGSIDSYVRVILYKSWSKGEGENAVKDTTLSPALIDLNLTGNGWTEDKMHPQKNVRFCTITAFFRQEKPLPSSQTHCGLTRRLARRSQNMRQLMKMVTRPSPRFTIMTVTVSRWKPKWMLFRHIMHRMPSRVPGV